MKGPAALDVFACPAGHIFLHRSDACPACGAPFRTRRVPPYATLVLQTTVRVNPGGEPFRLGIAVTRCGRARTLCRLEGSLRGSGHDPVILVRRGDGFVARGAAYRPGRAARVTGARSRG